MRAAAPLVLLLLTGCSAVGFQTPLDPAGDQAQRIHSIWVLMLWVTGFFYALVLGFLAWAVVRRRRQPEGDPPPSVHDHKLERTLAIWAGMIVAGLTVLTTWSFVVDRSLASTRDDDVMEVVVTGYQWWWRVEYQSDRPDQMVETANEIHLPADRTVRLVLRSGDVIHSFWVPNLAGKIDMIPGRDNLLEITPRREGTFRAQCAEFCGFQHAHMALTVTVESPEAFEAWRRAQQQPAFAPLTPAQLRGKDVFETNACAFCHKIGGTLSGGRTAPNLTHVASRPHIAAGMLETNPENLSRWIADPPGVKPGTRMPKVPLTPEEHQALVAYLSSLK